MYLRYTDVIFDLDGTLTKPGLIDFDAIKLAIGCPREHTLIEHVQGLRGAELRRAWRVIDMYERAAVSAARPNDGVYCVLQVLWARAVRVFVLTRNSRRNARATLHLLGLRPFVYDTIAREDTAVKPDPAGIRRLSARWGFDPARTLMVGDFRFDVLTGAAAGVRTAFLTNRGDGDPHAAFPTGHPTHVIPDLRALVRLCT